IRSCLAVRRVQTALSAAPLQAEWVHPGSAAAGSTIHVLALLPPVTPRCFPDRAQARQVSEPLILQQLRAAGFQVIPPDSFWTVWKATSDSLDAALGSRSDENRAPPSASGLPMHLAETPLRPEHFNVLQAVALARVHADAVV